MELFLAAVDDLLATSYGLVRDRQVRGEVNDVADKSAGKLRGSCRQVVSCRVVTA